MDGNFFFDALALGRLLSGLSVLGAQVDARNQHTVALTIHTHNLTRMSPVVTSNDNDIVSFA
jgi:hypothetical protein